MKTELLKLKTTLEEVFEGALEAQIDVRVANVEFTIEEIMAIMDCSSIRTSDGKTTAHILEKPLRQIRLGDVTYLKTLCDGKESKDETISQLVVIA